MWRIRAEARCGLGIFSNKEIHQGPQILNKSFSSLFLGLIQLHIQNLKNMNAVVFHSHSVNFPSSCSVSRKLQLGRPLLKDGPLPFASKKDGLQLSVSSTKSDGSRRGRPTRKSSASGRTRKEDKSEKYQFSSGKLPKSPNQEEILALFKRIKSTISKEEAKSTKQTNSNLSSTESILEVLRQSKKPIKDRTRKKGGDKVLVRKQGVPQKDHKTQNDVDHSASNLNLTRPPSNFVRRSPIPSPSSPRGNSIVSNGDPSKTYEDNETLMLLRIEEMKLPELKELAKSRGFKGYSKLKKSELLELLRS